MPHENQDRLTIPQVVFTHWVSCLSFPLSFFTTMAELARASPAKSEESRQDRGGKREAGRFTYMPTKWRLLLVSRYANLAVLSMHACPNDNCYSVWRTTVSDSNILYIVGQVASCNRTMAYIAPHKLFVSLDLWHADSTYM